MAREFYLGKLGLQIDRKDENAIGFRYGNGTRLDVTQSTVGTADQQTRAARLVTRFGHLGSAAAGGFGAAWRAGKKP